MTAVAPETLSPAYLAGRNSQLDGLRGAAVALVLFHHWTAWGPGLDLGIIGVEFFFVLSGFLITRILLNQRGKVADGRASFSSQIGDFYKRRALRILPVFYIIVVLVFIHGAFEQRSAMGWHALFSSNILFFNRGEFSGFLSHFWTLAVEQQVYIVWPLILLLAPRAMILPIIVVAILSAPIVRSALYLTGHTNFAQYNTLVWSNLDTLGAGALAAWIHVAADEGARRRFDLVLKWLAPAALIAAILVTLYGGEVLRVGLWQTCLAAVCLYVVRRADRGIEGPVGRVLGWTPVVYLGLISYGVYVYHMFAPPAVGYILRAVGAPTAAGQGVFGFILQAGLTLVCASLSWLLIERHLNNLGRGRPSVGSERQHQKDV